MTSITMNRDDQERIKTLLTEAVTVLCRNGLKYTSHVAVDGLLGITVDDRDVFLVKLDEKVSRSDSSPDFSHVSELLGAARNNFGLSLNADGSSPLPLTSYGKDLNDNHTTTPINIAPLAGDSATGSDLARRGNKRGRSTVAAADMQTPASGGASKRSMMLSPSDSGLSPTSTSSAATAGGVGRLREDMSGNLVIKDEPLSDDENATGQQPPHTPYMGKTLGVISTVRTVDPEFDSANEADSSQGDGENQDGVLAALRAALIHKLANNGTPKTPTQNNNNNNESPCETPTPESSGSSSTPSGSAKRRKVTPKEEQSEVTLKCLMCTYETNRRYNFIRHMRGHSKSYAIYACDLCGERFHSEDELGAHGLEAHKGHHLTCDQCGMTFMSERGKNIHAKTHKMMPIPEKKSVECETQCSQIDLEDSLAHIGPGVKVMTAGAGTSISASGSASGDESGQYRTLREQLSSRSLVIRFPVVNGKVQKSEKMSEGEEESQEENDQPADLRIASKTSTCSTSTSPPPPGMVEKTIIPTASKTAPPALKSTQSSMVTATPKDLSMPKGNTTTSSTPKTVKTTPVSSTLYLPMPKGNTTTSSKPKTVMAHPMTTVHTTPVSSSLSIAAKSVTSSTSAVLPTSALSAALAAAAKAKSQVVTVSSSPRPVTASTSSPKAALSEGEIKSKSRKQSSAQIVRLVTVKKEPEEQMN